MKISDRIAVLGLAIFVMAGAGASSASPPSAPDSVDWTKSAVVSITMSNFAFAPSPIVLQSGIPYRLHFVNSSSSSHNFKAPEFFDATIIAPDSRSKIEDGDIDVAKNATLDVELVPTTAGRYPVECTHFLHAMMGMTTEIVVK